jgi:hypothetical protein
LVIRVMTAAGHVGDRGASRRVPIAVAVTALLAAVLAFDVPTAAVGKTDATVAMERFLAREAIPNAYRGSRRLEAAGSGQRGWLDADTEFTPAAGLRYTITAEGGSGYIRSRVLRSLLEEERELIARGGSPEVAISRANYRLNADRIDADGRARVVMQPLRKERPLIIGRMLLSPDDDDLVRVEGRLAKNPSFWVTRVNVVRTYGRINGIAVPVLLESTAQLRFLGRSTLRMTYAYSELNEVRVASEGDR